MSQPPSTPVSWYEERLRYHVLRFIYDHVGPNCDITLSSAQIGVALALTAGDVIRIVSWLDERGYVNQFGSRPDICLTPKAIKYLEISADRRRSVRA